MADSVRSGDRFSVIVQEIEEKGIELDSTGQCHHVRVWADKTVSSVVMMG